MKLILTDFMRLASLTSMSRFILYMKLLRAYKSIQLLLLMLATASVAQAEQESLSLTLASDTDGDKTAGIPVNADCVL